MPTTATRDQYAAARAWFMTQAGGKLWLRSADVWRDGLRVKVCLRLQALLEGAVATRDLAAAQHLRTLRDWYASPLDG